MILAVGFYVWGVELRVRAVGVLSLDKKAQSNEFCYSFRNKYLPRVISNPLSIRGCSGL